ncbi:FkbM family methyltransferase [Aurantimonas endophytica]|uniref:FkbM family methyltransferase n=1 Tax=Aurantimonas endophytica TaxID=1522175 RepID=A0A7W6HH38_9HYPH|nr:FkbM family methyltransferase [Aurantimonas endophytica]MBB4004827.1 FkbM family methyltransferase [Aurantimonas endophytica]MCO6405637.1 FkbM family methyltransferase [Aurantimonas endophytica]
MMKNRIRTLFKKTGFDVVRLRNSNFTLSTHLMNVFEANAIDCVIDVGANAGQYGAFLRDIGFAGHIVSFEPVASVFDRLESRAEADGKWISFQSALGETSEQRTINVYDSTMFSSFLDANAYSKEIWNSLKGVRPETVTVATLDELMPELIARTGATNFFLKMDTQGFDRHVFRGAQASLPHIRALQSELSLIAVYEDMPPPYETLNDFHRENYFISGMYPINRDKSLAVIEYDCVLVRR